MPTLYVLSGPDLGRIHEVEDGVVLGRANECDVVLHAGSISRRHARLSFEEGSWFVVDLGSRNGVFLGEQRGLRLELTDGAIFRLGDLELRFRLAEATLDPVAPAAAPAPVEPEFDESIEFDEPEEAAADLIGGVEIELENQEALDAPPPLPSATPQPTPGPAASAARAAAAPSREAEQRRAAALERASTRASLAGSVEGGAGGVVADSGRKVLRYSREADDAGFAGADLSQYPAWVRALIALLAIGVFVGVFWVAMKGTEFLKGRSAGPAPVIETE
jgi:pSer/pThr/pTyr-binding forkhead associated (FHA) protein